MSLAGDIEVAPTLSATVLALGRLEAVADPAGALFFPAERALVVADLHLEKASTFARRGQLLPPYDSRATLERLTLLMRRHAPRTVIALGDSFHEPGAENRLPAEDRERLAALQHGRDWVWITGNHDPQLSGAVGGEVVGELRLGGVVLRHEPGGADEACEIAGHLHPVAKVRVSGRGAVRRRCFVVGRGRCLLPAFGAYAGGLNVRDGAFRPLFPDGLTAHVLGRRLFAIGEPLLMPD